MKVKTPKIPSVANVRKLFKAPKNEPFVSPGKLTYIGRKILDKIFIRLFVYDQDTLELKEMSSSEGTLPDEQKKQIWLDVDGVHDIEVIQEIGKKYKLHPLLMEDVLNTTQKSKFEYFDQENQIFIVLKMLHLNQTTFEVDAEQISLVLGQNFVISFQERDETDIFSPVYDRLKNSKGLIRRYEVEYLLYVLLDVIIDNYIIIMELMAERLEEIEAQVLKDPQEIHQTQIYNLKKEILFMRRLILPVRDVLGMLIREDSDLVTNRVNVYLRDAQDHVLQTLESLDTYREMADNIMSSYQSALSNRMNSVMKTLTVFTVIFMPLSFVAGLYGMNFVNMPELQAENGYFWVLGIMGAMGIALFSYFKWKRFL